MAFACRLNGTELGITGLEFLTGDHAGEKYPLSRYVRQDGSMKLASESLKKMLADYVEANPGYRQAIIIKMHPHKIGMFYITDREGTVNLGELTKKQLGERIEGDKTLFDLISFKEIAENTRTYENGGAEEEAPLEKKISAWEITPARAAGILIAGAALIYASCTALNTYNRKGPAFEPISYETVKLDQRIKSTLLNIQNYSAFIESDDKESAEYQLSAAKWFVSKIDTSSLSEPQKKELEKINKAIKEAEAK